MDVDLFVIPSLSSNLTIRDITGDYVSYTWPQTFVLIISNFILVAPFVYSLKLKMLTRAIVIFSAMFFSSGYHYCKTEYSSVCSFRLFIYFYYLDFFFSLLLVVNSALLFLPYEVSYIYKRNDKRRVESHFYYEKLEFILTVIYAVMISFILFYYGEPNLLIYIMIIISIFVIIGAIWVFTACKYHRYPVINKKFLILGLLLVSVAIILFASQDYFAPSLYWLYHSIWHLFGGIAILFFIKSKLKGINQ